MRSLAFIALGSFVASISLTGQSLTEHAAAAAGATIGTAAGKPLGTALGKIFGSMDQSTSKAAGTAKVVKPVEPKATVRTAPAPVLGPAPSAGSGGSGGGESASAPSGHSTRRHELRAEEPLASAPIAPVTPIPAPEVKEPSVEQIAAIQVGATSNELEAALGAPESHVSIPDDDGRLLEICQYWAKGQPLGTIRLENGHVVSVQTRSN